MSDYSDEEVIKVEKSSGKKKNISLKNIEPMSGIQVIRDSSPDISSSDTDSTISVKPKKTKKVLRRKERTERPDIYRKPQEYDYSAFSNPKKVNKIEEELSENASSYESDNDSEVHSEPDNIPQGDSKPKETWEDKQKMKQDLLIKIQALEKKGFEFSKKFTMTSNYEEMMFEYQKIKKFVETQAAIKFSRRCLMACVTGLEFLNKRFDPFKLKLEGWSENVMENVDDYDNIFEKLHEKYGGKAQVSPEVELLLTLGGSAFMFHLTNTLLKGNGNGGGGLLAQNNPNFMASMMGAMSQGMKEMNVPPSGANMAQMFQQQQMQQQKFPQPMETRGARQEMRGPNIDQNLFNGTPLASNHPTVVPQRPPMAPTAPPVASNYYNNTPPIDDDDRFSIASSDSSLSSIQSESFKSVTVKKAPGKKGKGGGGLELNIN
jgi:hypothetical protein